jgi:hypothetical protein
MTITFKNEMLLEQIFSQFLHVRHAINWVMVLKRAIIQKLKH